MSSSVFLDYNSFFFFSSKHQERRFQFYCRFSDNSIEYHETENWLFWELRNKKPQKHEQLWKGRKGVVKYVTDLARFWLFFFFFCMLLHINSRFKTKSRTLTLFFPFQIFKMIWELGPIFYTGNSQVTCLSIECNVFSPYPSPPLFFFFF